MARERGVVNWGSDNLANRAGKSSIDGDRGLGGAHVERFGTVAEAREHYRLLLGTDLIRMAPEREHYVRLGKIVPRAPTLERYPQKNQTWKGPKMSGLSQIFCANK